MSEDRAAELLEAAATLAGDGRPADAAEAALEAARLLDDDDPDRAIAMTAAVTLLARAGNEARLAGGWNLASSALERALELADATDAEGQATAVVAQDLAVVYKYTGRFDEAEQLYRRSLAVAEAVGDRCLEAVVCHNLGGLAHARGDHASGIPWARRSVAVRSQLDDALGLAADRGALAGLLIDAGELAEAAGLLHAARSTFVDVHGEDHHEVAVVDGNLATIALEQGDLAEAERRATNALRLKEQALGADHPELAVTLTTLGTIRRRRGHGKDAARLHRRALAVLRPAVEPDHPLLRTIEANLRAATARR